MSDVYKTIENHSCETVFKDRNSKFYGYAFSVQSEDSIRDALIFLKKKHRAAQHFCYAWKLGTEGCRYRANDDGEPTNVAGMSIYSQILSFEVTNVLVVSVRYFGGTKLGVKRLSNAYRCSAKQTLEAAIIIEKTIDVFCQLNFQYDLMSKVMRIIREHSICIQHQKLETSCEIIIAIRKSNVEKVTKIFSALYQLEMKVLEGSLYQT